MLWYGGVYNFFLVLAYTSVFSIKHNAHKNNICYLIAYWIIIQFS